MAVGLPPAIPAIWRYTDGPQTKASLGFIYQKEARQSKEMPQEAGEVVPPLAPPGMSPTGEGTDLLIQPSGGIAPLHGGFRTQAVGAAGPDQFFLVQRH